jgi:hypothetical protein
MGGREISILGMADHARGFRRIAVAAAKITVVAPVPGTCNWVAVDEREFVYSLELGRHRCRLRVLGRASTVASCVAALRSGYLFVGSAMGHSVLTQLIVGLNDEHSDRLETLDALPNHGPVVVAFPRRNQYCFTH